MTDPWLPPAQTQPQPSAQPQAQPYAPPQPYAQPYVQPQAFAAAPVAAPRGSNALAITALVVATLALLGVIGLGVALAVHTFDEGYVLEGTLPQAEPGRTYTADEVRTEVERVLERDLSTYEGLECDPLVFAPEAYTSCTGVVDGFDTELELDVVDASGHFVLTQYW